MDTLRFRNKGFIRGMCHCVWHDKEGWGLSEETKRIDEENFKELKINSWRTWGDIDDEGLVRAAKLGRSYAPTMRNGVAGSVDSSGKKCGNVWADENECLAFIERIEKIAQCSHTELIETYLLGNEQSMQTRNKQNYITFSGYDPITQKCFKTDWLKKRFLSIETLNSLCKCNFLDFDAVNPEENRLIQFEYWLFLRKCFEDFLDSGIRKVHEQNHEIRFGYARLMGRANPTCDDAHCDFMETATQNLYWHWWRDFSRFSVRLDELCSSGNRPVYITETGMQGMFNLKTEQLAARRLKQILPLMYMRPQVKGCYVFCYAGQLPNHNPKDAEYTWGMCWPDRTKKPAFYAVKQVYSDFEMLDHMIGSCYTVQLVAITNQLVDELIEESYDSDKIAKVLYAHGVSIRFLRSDCVGDFKDLSVDRLIVNDRYFYSNPDKSGNITPMLNDYLSNGKKRAITLSSKNRISLYGADLPLEESIERKPIDKNDPNAVWNALADFIHGDFIMGVSDTNSDADIIRILDTESAVSNQKWGIQQQLLYLNGKAILVVVNTLENPVESINITFGTVNDICMNVNVICSDGKVAADVVEDVFVPKWIMGEYKVNLHTVCIKNLDTYAFVEINTEDKK